MQTYCVSSPCGEIQMSRSRPWGACVSSWNRNQICVVSSAPDTSAGRWAASAPGGRGKGGVRRSDAQSKVLKYRQAMSLGRGQGGLSDRKPGERIWTSEER